MSNANYSILLVDDETEIRAILENFIAPLGLTILHADNGEEALKILRDSEDSIITIVSDIAMPKMDGLQLLKESRAAFSHIPFVLLTAFGEKENVLEALRLGAIDFLTKPFDDVEVLRVMRRTIEIGKSNRAIEKLNAQGAGNADDNVLRLFDIQKEKRKRGLLTAKKNLESKRKKTF